MQVVDVMNRRIPKVGPGTPLRKILQLLLLSAAKSPSHLI
jgi:hypothetical protein